jgi:hypothetical protein
LSWLDFVFVLEESQKTKQNKKLQEIKDNPRTIYHNIYNNKTTTNTTIKREQCWCYFIFVSFANVNSGVFVLGA